MTKIKPDTLDWNELWKQARLERSSGEKKASDWDRKAPAFARRNADSLYADTFIKLLNPRPTWSVLDVGSGPGTIAIPLARRVRKITAIDFSPKMLEILAESAGKKGAANISVQTLSWTDNWRDHGIPVHDVAIASRSLAVNDLRAALEKLNRFARKTVVITDKVGPGPFDPEAFSAVGRELKTGPDYMYTINLLHQMGVQASVNFIRLESTLLCKSMEEAMDLYIWMFPALSTDEKKRLKKYVQSITTTAVDGTFSVHRKHIPTWAFIRWDSSDE